MVVEGISVVVWMLPEWKWKVWRSVSREVEIRRINERARIEARAHHHVKRRTILGGI
jgi:hypothetical protein